MQLWDEEFSFLLRTIFADRQATGIPVAYLFRARRLSQGKIYREIKVTCSVLLESFMPKAKQHD